MEIHLVELDVAAMLPGFRSRAPGRVDDLGHG